MVRSPTRDEMRGRTWWGDMIDGGEERADIDAARTDPGIMQPSDDAEPEATDRGDEGADETRWHWWWWPEW